MKSITTVIILILFAVIFWYFISLNNNEADLLVDDSVTTIENEKSEIPQQNIIEEEMSGELKEYTISGSNFKFSITEINVDKGDRVRINFINEVGDHDWKLEGYNVGTKILRTGQSEIVEFVASQSGTFEYYCSVGTHRAMGMKGILVVD